VRFVLPPLLDNKNPTAKSVFEPSALLREARRQKGLATVNVPSVCVLDPDGDIVRRLKPNGRALLAKDWPCYHTELYAFAICEQVAGIVGVCGGRSVCGSDSGGAFRKWVSVSD